MTDKLHYQDMFTTINIPQSEKHLALVAKNLFDVVHDVSNYDPEVYLNLKKAPLDSINASQIFWERENKENHTRDFLALTAMKHTLTFAVEHKDFRNESAGIRRSLSVYYGSSREFITDRRSHFAPEDFTYPSFEDDLLEVTARLGLSHFIKEVMDHELDDIQSESSSAILASAA